LVIDYGEFDRRRELPLDLLKLLRDRIGGRNGIGVAFLVNRQLHRFSAT
jgi:hypothetical protein